ncbi:MAG TPA: hypothetical protein VLM37_09995 [Fibrobacteraceae bacterium]|nr:hypothetical protein [Fibrobacteraceae bacterium]
MFSRLTSFFLFLALPFCAGAKDFLNWSESSGQGAFSFLEIFQGARTVGLSGAGGSIPSTDPLSVAVNPAVLQRSHFHQYFAADWQTGALAEDHGLLAWNLTLGMYMVQTTVGWVQVDKIWQTDESSDTTGNTFSPTSQYLAFTTVVPSTHFWMGATLKFIRDQLWNDDTYGDQAAWGIGGDLGLVWKSPFPRFGAGLSVLDLGRQVSSYLKDGEENYALNTRIRISGHYRPAQIRGMTLALDAEFPRYSQPSWHAGLEYLPIPSLSLRAGATRTIAHPTSTSQQWNLFNAGFGLLWRSFSFDYALQVLTDNLGIRHQFGLQTGF